MATNVHLTPELEKFARSCVEEGRYNNVSEVMRAALRLLQEQEERKKAFGKMLQDAHDEGVRDGFYTLEEVLASMDAIIDGESE